MTLTSAIRTATSSLASHSQQIANLSRNISGIGDPNYVRRESDVYTALFGTTRVETQRYVNISIQRASIGANADAEYSSILAGGLDRISMLQGGNNFALTPANLLGSLRQMVEFAASSPSDDAAMASLIEQARTVSSALNTSYAEVLSMREQADKEISQSVQNINSLLGQIKELNDTIVNGTRAGQDVFDSLDVRDQLIDELSREIGIKTVSTENNGIIITTKNGAMLFEGKPREVSFNATASYGPLTNGGELQIDGVTVSGPNSSLRVETGRIGGNLELRDTVLVDQLNQLDEIARGLVDIFSEKDQTGGGKPPLAGLFTWSGGPAVPISANIERGIASTIRLNPLVDPELGGNPTLVRDGVANGDPDYLYNIDGAVGFGDRLFELADAFDVSITFDPAAKLQSAGSLSDFASSSADYLNAKRSSALSENEYRFEVASQFKQSLQNQSGPNLDYEMSRLLEVERAYQATAQLLNAVDQMFATLLEAAA